MTDPSERLALHRCILETPDDDAPRLIYSDVLDEDGEDERADSIRRAIKHPDDWSSCDGWHLLGREEHGDIRGIYRRGFVAEVRLTCAAFMTPERECGRCRGQGLRSRGPIGASGSQGQVTDFCPDCKEGRIPGMAETLFKSHPITRMELTDRRPENDGDESTETTFVRWLTDRRPVEHQTTSSADERRIPLALARLMPRSSRGGEYLFQYPNLEAAFDAISTACVAYGRRLAGLPPLPTPTPLGRRKHVG